MNCNVEVTDICIQIYLVCINCNAQVTDVCIPQSPNLKEISPLGWWSLWPDTPSPLVEHHDSWCQVPLQIQTQTWIIIKEMQFEKEEIHSPSKSMLTRSTLTIRPPPLSELAFTTRGKKCKKKDKSQCALNNYNICSTYTQRLIFTEYPLVLTWWQLGDGS